MKNPGFVEKNLDLAHQFLLYAFDHPGVLDRIPAGAQVVFLPSMTRSSWKPTRDWLGS